MIHVSYFHFSGELQDIHIQVRHQNFQSARKPLLLAWWLLPVSPPPVYLPCASSSVPLSTFPSFVSRYSTFASERSLEGFFHFCLTCTKYLQNPSCGDSMSCQLLLSSLPTGSRTLWGSVLMASWVWLWWSFSPLSFTVLSSVHKGGKRSIHHDYINSVTYDIVYR